MDTVDSTVTPEIIPSVSTTIPDDGRRPGEISLEEAGKLLGVSPKRVRRLCNSNVLPHVTRFNFIFIPQDSLYEWYSLPENRALIRPFQVYPVTIDCVSDDASGVFSIEDAFVKLNERLDGLETLLQQIMER